MVDRWKIWKTVLISWMFTVMGIFNMLFITAAIGILAFRFTGRVTAVSLLGAILLMSLMTFLLSEVLINFMLRASKPDPEKHRDFLEAVNRVCRKKKMWFKPRLYILKLGVPNAMAYGWGFWGQYAVGITPELYGLLTESELEGVVAHEIAHIRCKDVGILTTISLLTGSVDKLKDLFLKGKTVLGRGPFALLFGALLWFVSRVVFVFLRAAVSQERELAADALGCSYVGTPDPLISALGKLAGAHPRGGDKSIFKDLFISHPAMDERLSSLQSLKGGKQ
jgi:heat shock protein HtpX